MKLADDATTPWVRRFHPTTEGWARLVCFPHAGVPASFFDPVAATFAPGIDVVALQYPGCEDRRNEPQVADIGTLADLVTAELSRLSDLPTVFYGHSTGAVLAFEVAWRLDQRYAGPRLLLLSGTGAPAPGRPGQPVRRVQAPIVAMAGDADPGTTVAEAEAWSGHTRGGFRMKVFPGGQFFVTEQADAVFEEIGTEIALLGVPY